MLDDIEIIESDKSKEKFKEHCYGSEYYYLTKDHLKALSEGKCLAFKVNDEYAVFIDLG